MTEPAGSSQIGLKDEGRTVTSKKRRRPGKKAKHVRRRAKGGTIILVKKAGEVIGTAIAGAAVRELVERSLPFAQDLVDADRMPAEVSEVREPAVGRKQRNCAQPPRSYTW